MTLPEQVVLTEVLGGQIWEAPWPLCWSLYVVSGRHGLILINDPREQGSMVWESVSPDWYSAAWWGEYFREHHYTYKGQLHDLILDELEVALHG